jgi:hypothetical protein
MLNRDIFEDATGEIGRAAYELGLAHQRLRYPAFNCTPLGTALASPPPAHGEIWCKDGLKYYARIRREDLESTLEQIERQRARLRAPSASLLRRELELAARMAAESCRYMLWQQDLAAGKIRADAIARRSTIALRKLEKDFAAYWPKRNKATPERCFTFLRWRIDDYQKRILHYTPTQAREEP